MTKLLLLAGLLVSSPGPIDQYGGHTDPSTGGYHFHSGPSIQMRYVDGAGLVHSGAGPGGEFASQGTDDMGIFSSSFLFYTVFFATGAGLLAWWIEERWRSRRHFRRKRRHSRPKAPPAFLQRTA